MTPTAALQAALTDLTGPTFGPTDPGYDAAKRVYNAMIDKSPALIVQAHTVADVVAGVNAARDHGVLLAVRGGGHNGGHVGHCVHLGDEGWGLVDHGVVDALRRVVAGIAGAERRTGEVSQCRLQGGGGGHRVLLPELSGRPSPHLSP